MDEPLHDCDGRSQRSIPCADQPDQSDWPDFSHLNSLALTSFLVAVQIGHLWSRYAQETAALGFSGIYERFQAWQAGFSDDPTAYRAAVEVSAPGEQGSS